MGCYDTFGTIPVQLKAGECAMIHYELGDVVPIDDGVYLAYEGAVVIIKGKVAMVTKQVQDKWGGKINLAKVTNMNNPLVPYIEAAAENVVPK